MERDPLYFISKTVFQSECMQKTEGKQVNPHSPGKWMLTEAGLRGGN